MSIFGTAPLLDSVPATKADLAYRAIRRDIVEGRLPADMVLDQESLAAAHGLSVTPVREALNKLEAEGLVINRPHRRTVVAPLSRTMFEQTYAVRMVLDPLAAELAAERSSAEEVVEIVALAERKPEQDPVEALHGNRRLHRAIYSASGNATLTSVLDMLYDRSDRYRVTTLRTAGTKEIVHQEHRQIAHAIRERDAARASALMHEHTVTSFARICALPLPTD